jgi:type IV pilus assembly protein PilA
MKSFFKSLKRQSGFTLVELMVVVAIIGLLSAVAIPNFRKYQAKSKMSEAKLQLSSLYTAETAFFSDFNIYGTCLSYMGYDPSPEFRQRYYAVGFAAGADIVTAAWDSAKNSGLQEGSTVSTCDDNVLTSGQDYYFAGKGTGANIANATNYLDDTMLGTQADNSSDPAVATGMTFRAAASGVIDGNFTTETNSSHLTIDNNKKVEVRRNGY